MKKKDDFDIKRSNVEQAPPLKEIGRIDDQRFSKRLDELIAESEEMRLNRMKQNRSREFMAMNTTILCCVIGVSAFGWYFLMEAKMFHAMLSLAFCILPPIFLYSWAKSPVKAYITEHKTVFMPKMAHALNGLQFFPERGISEKILEKVLVMPAYDRYEAEDCFMGVYKGVKVMFSEARLYARLHKSGKAFDGIFVLLEIPNDVIEGHTIITANPKMVKEYEKKRWKDLTKVSVVASNPAWDKFTVFSSKPEAAELIVGDRLLKELSEAGDIFDNAALTAVLFGRKYVFIMIPYEKDMFEPSDIHVPVTTKQHALQCKKEIEQLIEIIDIFDLYKPVGVNNS